MMRERIVIWGAWALVGTVATAQSPAPVRPGPPDATQAQSLMLKGCVRVWDASTMGPPPAAMGTAAPVLILTQAENAATAPPATTSTTADPAKPPTGGAPAAGGHSTYLLKPVSSAVHLDTHLDHLVELSGTLATDHAAATPAAPTTPPGSSATGAPSDGTRRAPAPPVSFTVERITMIDKACPAK
jgi:hypothetical protein